MPEMDQNLSNIWGNQHLVTSYFYKKTRVSAVQTHTSSRIPMIFNDSWYPWVNAGESPLWYVHQKQKRQHEISQGSPACCCVVVQQDLSLPGQQHRLVHNDWSVGCPSTLVADEKTNITQRL
jgi:hypothetical protein